VGIEPAVGVRVDAFHVDNGWRETSGRQIVVLVRIVNVLLPVPPSLLSVALVEVRGCIASVDSSR